MLLVFLNGYIVTNGHVVGIFNDDIRKVEGILFRVIALIIQVFQQEGQQLSQQDVQLLQAIVFDAYKRGDLKISNLQNLAFVGLGQIN